MTPEGSADYCAVVKRSRPWPEVISGQMGSHELMDECEHEATLTKLTHSERIGNLEASATAADTSSFNVFCRLVCKGQVTPIKLPWGLLYY